MGHLVQLSRSSLSVKLSSLAVEQKQTEFTLSKRTIRTANG